MEKDAEVTYPTARDPSPEEIAERAAAIREGWTDRARVSRRQAIPRPSEPPRPSVELRAQAALEERLEERKARK